MQSKEINFKDASKIWQFEKWSKGTEADFHALGLKSLKGWP